MRIQGFVTGENTNAASYDYKMYQNIEVHASRVGSKRVVVGTCVLRDRSRSEYTIVLASFANTII